MGEFVPWSQLVDCGVIGAEEGQTVEAIQRRLGKLDKDSQANAPILIRVADGRIAPTNARMLSQLAQAEGGRILTRRLGDLVDSLCPEPWVVDSQGPDYEDAVRAANRRRLPVVVAEDGQIKGLMLPSRRRALEPAGSEKEFDLLDEPDLRSFLDQTEFVAATANTTVAKVAQYLKSKRNAEAAFVVVQMGDGSYRVMTTRQLRNEARQLGAEVWSVPLVVFVSSLPVAACRELDSVDYEQARAIANTQEYLVLTQGGKPVGLLTRGIVTRGIDPSTETTSSAETVGSLTPTVKPATSPRSVNLWFTDRTGQTRARSQPLELGNPYLLKVNIGQLFEESIVRGEYPPIREPLPQTAAGTTLYVSLFADGAEFDIPNPTKTLWLPPSGDSLPVEFEVTPLRQTLGPDDRATLDVHVYYRCNVVQSWRVQIEIVLPGDQARSKEPQQAVRLADRAKDYVALEEIGPRHLSVIIEQARDDTYRFDFVVAADGQADEVQLSCQVNLRREELTHLITKARRQLYSICRSRAYQADIAGDPPTRQKAMNALAVLGRQLYSRLFDLAEPESSASRVGAWIKCNLPDGSTIQIIDRARSFIFPWALVYDEVPWDRDGLSREVAPGGFWGYRFKIEILTPDLLQTYQSQGTEIEATTGVRVGVGLNEGIPWSQAQRAFFEHLAAEAGERAKCSFFDSSRQLTDFLERGDQHVFYIFCHGFTERMAADIQIGDDLIGGFRAWLGSLPAEQRQALKDQEDALFDVSDSWIKLTYGTVPLTMMEYYAAPQLSNAPLVFLNMCESAQVLPSLSGGFIPFFLQRGARGVIGTECPMTSTFADPFAREFFQEFLRGQAVGQVLWDLRRRYLEKGNPLGLAYTLYGDAATKLGEPILDSPVSSTKGETTSETLQRQINKLWLQQEDELFVTLGINQQAVETAQKRNDTQVLQRAQQYDTVFNAQDTEMGVLDDLKAFGKRWWAKLEPKIHDLLCNSDNSQHDQFMQALAEGAQMLALALVPSLLAPGVVPAVAVVVATIAAKKIYESGLEAVCEMWAESMQAKALGEQA